MKRATLCLYIPEVTDFTGDVRMDNSVTIAFDSDQETSIVMNFENMETLCDFNSRVDKFIQSVDDQIENTGGEDDPRLEDR
jgi:hypothetical protein